MLPRAVCIGIIGDFYAASHSHQSTNNALQHASQLVSNPITWKWIATDTLSSEAQLADCDALWIAPGSPYKNMDAVLFAIRYARENDMPLLGTCGGFQHLVLEYARNVLGLTEAQHAEYSPEAALRVVTPLACSLVGQRHPVRLLPDCRACHFYNGATEIEEEYRCNFGLNRDYQTALEVAGLRVVGTDAEGAVRVMELSQHRFFIGMLFVPQCQSTSSAPHPLILAFVKSAVAANEGCSTPL